MDVGSRSWRERAVVALVGLAATWALFVEYLPPFKRAHLWSDVVGYSYPLHRYAFSALKAGRIPEWDASIYCGISFAGNVQASLFYPPTWLLYASVWTLSRIPFKAIEVFAFAHLWIAFVLAYFWLRNRFGGVASALGAATFAFAGQTVYELLHLGVTCATAWLPLALWGVDEAARRRDWRPLWKAAAASALVFLAGYPSSWVAFCVIVMAYALASAGRWRTALATAAALCASVLLFLAQLWPTVQAASLMQVDPRYYPAQYDWKSLLAAHLVPNWFDFNPGHPTYFNPGCMYFYLGLPCLVAIGWALAARRLALHGQAAIVLAVAFLFANPVLPMVRAVERIPALAGTMHPNEFYAGVSAMAALITAAGLDDYLRRTKRSAVPVALAAAILAALAALSARQLSIAAHGGHFPTGTRAAAETAVEFALFAAGVWIFARAQGRMRTIVAAVLLLSAGIDYKAFGTGRWFNAIEGDEDRYHPAYGIGGVDDAAYRATEQNRQYRVATARESGPAATDYRYWDLATPAGFDPLLPVQYKRAIERWTPFRTNREFDVDFRSAEMMQTLGVRYVLARKGSPEDNELKNRSDYRLIGRDDVFCHVYEYANAREPFFTASGADARAVAWTPEQREFDVHSDRADSFVLIEQFYPGWEAAVDGRPVAIERWNGAFQTIAIPAGARHVTFRYRPASWRLGMLVSAVSALALALFVWRQSRGAMTRPAAPTIPDLSATS